MIELILIKNRTWLQQLGPVLLGSYDKPVIAKIAGISTIESTVDTATYFVENSTLLSYTAANDVAIAGPGIAAITTRILTNTSFAINGLNMKYVIIGSRIILYTISMKTRRSVKKRFKFIPTIDIPMTFMANGVDIPPTIANILLM